MDHFSCFFHPELCRGDYAGKRYMCFSGLNDEIYEPARIIAKKISKNSRYILINTFHNPYVKVTSRILATPVDLFLRMRAIRIGSDVRNDSRYVYKNWDEFDKLILVSEKCYEKNENRVSKKRLIETGK